MQARTLVVLCGLFCLAAAFRSDYHNLPPANVQRSISSSIPLNEAFISGFYVGFIAAGDLGIVTYYPDDPSLNELLNDPSKYLYLIIYNGQGDYLYYKWLGGNSDRILTNINGGDCYSSPQCIYNAGFAQSYNGIGQRGAFIYGYLYIPDRVAAPFLSGVNNLATVFGWGSGVTYLTQGVRSVTQDGAQFFVSFNPAVLVGDPHLQTDLGYQQSIETSGALDASYALYCDFDGNWINGVVYNTLAGAYILTELELQVSPITSGQYSISGYRDANGFPVLVLNGASFYFETYDAVGLEIFDVDLQMMTWIPSNDPEFDGELSRYYRRVLHIFYVYNSIDEDYNRITIRVGFHPQIKGFFEVLVSPIPEYVRVPPSPPSRKVETDSQVLHTRNTIRPVGYDRPGGLLYKDAGDSLSTYAISNIRVNVCSAL